MLDGFIVVTISLQYFPSFQNYLCRRESSLSTILSGGAFRWRKVSRLRVYDRRFARVKPKIRQLPPGLAAIFLRFGLAGPIHNSVSTQALPQG